jgi:RNA polymerase sigma factor (sigma-70 family)
MTMNNVDEQIINGLKTKDQRSVQLLVHQYGSYIYTVIYNILKTKTEAEEACQDSFMKIINKIEDYNYTSAFKSWIFTIAYRTGIDYKRKQKNNLDESALAYTNATEKADDMLSASEEQKNIKKLLDILKEDERELVTMFYLNEMSIKEICDATSFGESNIKIKLYRARKEMALHIDKYFEKY